MKKTILSTIGAVLAAAGIAWAFTASPSTPVMQLQNPATSTLSPLALQGPADNGTNPSVKIPVLSARANAAAPTWTEGNVVPFSVDLAGNARFITAAGSPVTATQGTSAAGSAPWVMNPVQGPTLLNVRQVSAAGTAQTITLTGAASQRVTIRKVVCFCSAACTTPSTLVVQDNAVTIVDFGTFAVTGTGPYSPDLGPVGATGGTGNSMQVVAGAGGAGITTTCSVVADRQ